MEHYGNMKFATKKELFKFMSDNKDKLIAQKKAVKKEGLKFIGCEEILDKEMVDNILKEQP